VSECEDLNREGEKGVALVVAIIVVAILSVVALTALAFSSNETRIAGSELNRMQAHYAAQSGLEKMTNDFSNLFQRKTSPTAADLLTIRNSPPTALQTEGFTFTQTLVQDDVLLNKLRAIQGLSATDFPTVNVPDGPYAGLSASLIPYRMSSRATQGWSSAQVELERDFNNYLIPLFQFGVFSNDDIVLHPGPLMTFNGRMHTNKNFYAIQNTIFLDRLTIAGEFVRDSWRNGDPNTSNNVTFNVGGVDVVSQVGMGSVKASTGVAGGPNIVGALPNQRGYYPGSPNGVINGSFDSTSVLPVTGAANRFGGALLTGSTGAKKLVLPLELGGSNPAELIKRALPSDSALLSPSRYHNKAAIRVLIDDDNDGNGAANVAGIPAGKGLLLQDFVPTALNGNNVLRLISDAGAIGGVSVAQKNRDASITPNAKTVRAIKTGDLGTASDSIPPGSGLTGRIYIEVVKPDGTTIDVTQTILSMGVTEGEPNGIFYLQRPLWAAFVQGSRDRTGNGMDLVSLMNSQSIADGEIVEPNDATNFAAGRGYLNMTAAAANDDAGGPVREARPPVTANNYQRIVPINVYNVREGWYRSAMNSTTCYERGVTSVVEINMKNLSRWLDGVYDTNLLVGTNAVSTNIIDNNGYVVYVSDRRGDIPKVEMLASGATFTSTNGIVDNEDIYGPNGVLDTGEDVISFGRNADGTNKLGTLQNDTNELPTTGNTWAAAAGDLARSRTIASWPVTYFRRSVRTFNADTLTTTAAAGKLSTTKGVTIATENMLYTWGNFNTTGITSIPASGSTMNNGGYLGPQIPSSIVADAYFPLSKTWFDASGSGYPSKHSSRPADANVPDFTQTTSVRAGLIAGYNLSEMNGTGADPGRDENASKQNGGLHNFPRFLEQWSGSGPPIAPFNYSGSIAPLYYSTQALAQWDCSYVSVANCSVIYGAPRRNWSFDVTFRSPLRLPPGTPFFQYVSATAFRQKIL